MFDPIRESVTTPPKGAKVLDFGCGNGKLLDALQECGWDTWGIETAVRLEFPILSLNPGLRQRWVAPDV